jgi:hypothetical protein
MTTDERPSLLEERHVLACRARLLVDSKTGDPWSASDGEAYDDIVDQINALDAKLRPRSLHPDDGDVGEISTSP